MSVHKFNQREKEKLLILVIFTFMKQVFLIKEERDGSIISCFYNPSHTIWVWIWKHTSQKQRTFKLVSLQTCLCFKHITFIQYLVDPKGFLLFVFISFYFGKASHLKSIVLKCFNIALLKYKSLWFMRKSRHLKLSKVFSFV